jgi:hypothetical protein
MTSCSARKDPASYFCLSLLACESTNSLSKLRRRDYHGDFPRLLRHVASLPFILG